VRDAVDGRRGELVGAVGQDDGALALGPGGLGLVQGVGPAVGVDRLLDDGRRVLGRRRDAGRDRHGQPEPEPVHGKVPPKFTGGYAAAARVGLACAAGDVISARREGLRRGIPRSQRRGFPGTSGGRAWTPLPHGPGGSGRCRSPPRSVWPRGAKLSPPVRRRPCETPSGSTGTTSVTTPIGNSAPGMKPPPRTG